jgi:hypothetical protein
MFGTLQIESSWDVALSEVLPVPAAASAGVLRSGAAAFLSVCVDDANSIYRLINYQRRTTLNHRMHASAVCFFKFS